VGEERGLGFPRHASGRVSYVYLMIDALYDNADRLGDAPVILLRRGAPGVPSPDGFPEHDEFDIGILASNPSARVLFFRPAGFPGLLICWRLLRL
jgi:hypothetical protein